VGPGDARHFVAEAYKHGKAIGDQGEGVALLGAAGLPAAGGPEAAPGVSAVQGVVRAAAAAAPQAFSDALAAAIARHRHWLRPLVTG